MSLTRGEFLKSLGKSLPGWVASTGAATAAEALFRRVTSAAPGEPAPAAALMRQHEPVPFFTRGRTDDPAIALTFDDGPVPGVTERILDILRAHEVQATFFMIGRNVGAAPDLARRVVAEGHEIGHHTWSHQKLTDLSDSTVDQELDHAIFQDVLGQRPAWFRPPFGALRQDQARRVLDRRMGVAMWSLDSEDWRDVSVDSVRERILTHLEPGAIVLGHEVEVTTGYLDATLGQIKEASRFNLVTLGELARRVS